MDAVMIAAFLFLAGLLVGSFLTVVAHRVPRGESVVGGRSHCPACGAQIAAYDNVPVLSWLLLRGRARCCGATISPRYPLTELALGLLYAANGLAFHDDVPQLLLGLVFVSTLLAVTLTDLERRIIPNKILLTAAVLGVAITAIGDPGSLPERAIAAAAAGGLLLAAALAYPRGMGLGDVKLAATMGLFLGRDVAPAILVALVVGSLVGLTMIAREGAAARKRAIPFGPFLALGGLVGLFAGDEMVDWYLGTF
ncbi:MAG TPA: prepilin peptidase [Solirubrobacterales bacterium]|nr:prepilin peptidase [Solirubrobacterales bacterium]